MSIMQVLRILATLLLALCVLPTDCYRILCLFPFHGRSHYVMFGALCEGLAKRGHRIDMISHFPQSTPRANYTDLVSLKGTMKSVINSFSVEYTKELQGSLTYNIATTYGGDLCKLMEHEGMQRFIKNPPKDPPYDLVITEFFGSVCYMGFGRYLNTTLAIAQSSADYPFLDEIIANPLSSSFHPSVLVNHAVLDSFWDRLENTVRNFVDTRLFNWYTEPQTEMMRKYLGQDMPDVREVQKDVALALVNSHYSFEGIRPLTPGLVEVGGLHIEGDESKLTPELQKWLDSAKDGVVYFTLGSLVNIETLPKEVILDIYASFAKIAPIKVLMKIANKDKLPPGLPDNVITSSWIPQLPVLRHKNTRVFISHGGLMGSQEALYCGIPIIGIPLFADQRRNVNIFVHKRMAVSLSIDNINQKTLDAALDAVLNDPSYREAAERESRIFRDRPHSALNTAIYWVEYVIRNGPNSLKSPAVHMPWWQTNLLDVYAFLLSIAVIVLHVLRIVARNMLLGAPPTRYSSRRKKRD